MVILEGREGGREGGYAAWYRPGRKKQKYMAWGLLRRVESSTGKGEGVDKVRQVERGWFWRLGLNVFGVSLIFE